MSHKSKQLVKALLEEADILVDGTRPWDIRVNDERVFGRILKGGELAIGESYMDGDWDVERVDELAERIIRADLGKKLLKNRELLKEAAKARLINAGRRSRAFEIGRQHYDIGNELYRAMLDPRMVYTCGYWKNAATLAEAQEAKLDLICRKVNLKPGMRVLDIGGGWGGFAKFAAQKYGVSVVNATVSKEQVALANELCSGLPVENRLQDYREVSEKFDAIVSVGMFEHVGYKNYRTYMEVVNKNLSDSGLFLLHTIGRNTSAVRSDKWVSTYIFPNSMLPSVKQIGESSEGLFVMEDWHNFGTDYDKTLLAWYDNFENAWEDLKDQYGERFHRMWTLYLLGAAGAFRARSIQLWQVVFSKGGLPGGYTSLR